MRKWLVLLAVLGGCGGSTEPPPSAMVGHYTLTRVNNAPVPVTITTGYNDATEFTGGTVDVGESTYTLSLCESVNGSDVACGAVNTVDLPWIRQPYGGSFLFLGDTLEVIASPSALVMSYFGISMVFTR